MKSITLSALLLSLVSTTASASEPEVYDSPIFCFLKDSAPPRPNPALSLKFLYKNDAGGYEFSPLGGTVRVTENGPYVTYDGVPGPYRRRLTLDRRTFEGVYDYVVSGGGQVEVKCVSYPDRTVVIAQVIAQHEGPTPRLHAQAVQACGGPAREVGDVAGIPRDFPDGYLLRQAFLCD